MSTPSHGGKFIAIILVVLVGAAAGYGYLKQASVMSDAESKNTQTAVAQPSAETKPVLAVKPNDIILGDANAMVTVVEYNSLSCTHCAHFHETVLPVLDKEFITPGKVKFVLRHFPLNAPAMKASAMIECAGQNGLNRANFMKVLFEMQSKWAFDEKYEQSLKQIGRVGGLDSAALDSCLADKDLETRLLAGEQEASKILKVDGTPAFFIDGVKYDGERTAEGFRAALNQAIKNDADAIGAAPDTASAAESSSPASTVPAKPPAKPTTKPQAAKPADESESTED